MITRTITETKDKEKYMTSKKIIVTENAPKAIGPYSQAVEANNFVFISGQLPIDKSGQIPKDIISQTKAALENIKAILNSLNLDMENIVKTTVFMTDLSQFSAMNEIYALYFKDNFPARATIEVKALPRGAMIEIEAIASTR